MCDEEQKLETPTEKCECCGQEVPFDQMERRYISQTICAISHAIKTRDYILRICKICESEGWEVRSVHAGSMMWYKDGKYSFGNKQYQMSKQKESG